MSESEKVTRAATSAIARAKRRGSEQVTPDDLLVGLLREIARFGVAVVGSWAIDVESLEADAGDGSRPGGSGEGGEDGKGGSGKSESPRPAYAPETVRLFERAAAVAREDGATRTGIVHFLAACAEEGGLMAELRARLGCSPVEWRAALARGELVLPPRLAAVGGPEGDGTAGPGGSEPTLLGVEEAGSYLSVHPQTVRNYIRSGKLPAYRLAGERVIRVLRKDLLTLLEPVSAEDTE